MPDTPNPYLLKHLTRLINTFEQDLPKADRLLRNLFREERMGSRDRPWIRDRFYYYIRHRLTIQTLCQQFPERYAKATHALFTDEIPEWLQNAQVDLKEWTANEGESVDLNYPEWLLEEARKTYGDQSTAVLQWLDNRAPTTLRINPLKMDRDTVIKKLARDGIIAHTLAYSPWGLTIPEQEKLLSRTNLYKYGCFELQDESSQLVCLLVDPDASTLLDACAGGGGKTLTVGSLQPATSITATDIREYKLKDIARRADTAGVGVKLLSIPEVSERSFSSVLIDAPCTGTGVLRRNPEDRWRISPQSLEEIIAIQRECLEQYSALVQPGGELLYITCSFIRQENEENVEWFLEQHPDFKLVDPRPRLLSRVGDVDLDPLLQGDYLRLSPLESRDVFFAALLKKES